MGIAMAGMLTASLTTLPDGAWEAVFGRARGLVRLAGHRATPPERRRALAGGHHPPT